MGVIFDGLKIVSKTVGGWTVRHAPELLMVGGTVALGGSIIFSAKAGSETKEIVEDHKERLRDTKIAYARDEEVKKTDIVKVYGKTALNVTKTYAPAAGCGALAVACYFSAYGIIKKRYVALSLAYSALSESFNLYRQRVIDDKGREADLYYLTGEKPKTITVTNEDGTKEKKKVLNEINGQIVSPYAFKFSKYKENGDRNLQWQNNAMLNMSYVLGHQDYLNDVLYTRCIMNKDQEIVKRGSVMLNEVRDLLGEDPSSTGALVGWRFSNGEPECNGYVDFRVVEGIEKDPKTGADIPYILIDPNVDGMIYDLLDEFEKVPFKADLHRIGMEEEDE